MSLFLFKPVSITEPFTDLGYRRLDGLLILSELEIHGSSDSD